MRQVVILHGWSDTSKSFRPLADFLQNNGYEAIPLWLGDYVSLDDDVRIPDVARRMRAVVDELLNNGSLQDPFDMIVHSTGGLVAREWIDGYTAQATKAPVGRLVMLAPANFGSRLASMGQSMLGRVVKGFDNWFHTGKEMLAALELASDYQWDLASRDLFAPADSDMAPSAYGEDGVWPFVITGSHPYAQKLRQILNENGTDGTVRVAAANLNVQGITVDFAANEREPVLRPWRLRHEAAFPFAVLPDRTHGSVIDPHDHDVPGVAPIGDRLASLILEALQCADYATYRNIEAEWNQLTEATAGLGSGSEYFHQYLQVNVRVVDDTGAPVDDFFLEFGGPDEERGDDSYVYFHKDVLEHVHVNSRSTNHRCLFIDRTDLLENYYDRVRGRAAKVLQMSISAAAPGENIHYFTEETKGAAGGVIVHREDPSAAEPRWLRRNSTHFVEIIIPRRPKPGVFRLRRREEIR